LTIKKTDGDTTPQPWRDAMVELASDGASKPA
jgi:hypothetical protein